MAAAQGPVAGANHVVTYYSPSKYVTDALNRSLGEMGGIGKFIPKRAKVLIKPTMAWNHPPGTGFNSNPTLIRELIDLCYKAGAREVSLFDQAVDDWALSYKTSGIERVAKDTHARVWPANDKRYYLPTETAGNKKLIVHQAVVNATVIINVSVTRGLSDNVVNGSVSNYLRCIWRDNPRLENSVEQLAELLNYKSSQLNISEVQLPESDSQSGRSALIMSINPVDADMMAAHLLKIENSKITGLQKALEKHLGSPGFTLDKIKYLER